MLDLFVVWRIVIVAPGERPKGKQKGYTMNYTNIINSTQKAITTVEKLREWFPDGTTFTSKEYEEKRNMFGRDKVFAFSTIRDVHGVEVVSEEHFSIKQTAYFCGGHIFSDMDSAKSYKHSVEKFFNKKCGDIIKTVEAIDAKRYTYQITNDSIYTFLCNYWCMAHEYTNWVDDKIESLTKDIEVLEDRGDAIEEIEEKLDNMIKPLQK